RRQRHVHRRQDRRCVARGRSGARLPGRRVQHRRRLPSARAQTDGDGARIQPRRRVGAAAMSGHAIPAQRWVRIIPVAILMYTFALIDRNNIAFGMFGIQKELAIQATAAGLAAGIFFFGYVFMQIPGGLLAEKWSAKRFITTALVQNLTQLLIVRFVLGVVEGGVSPATMILLTKWFPLSERSRANALWYLCIPVASIITGPVSGWILTHYDWRMLFILEGAPAVVWAIVWWFLVDDKPSDAKWISPAERDYLE